MIVPDLLNIFGNDIANYPAFLYWVSAMLTLLIVHSLLNIVNAIFKRISGG